MKNPITKAYELVDDSLMYLANKAVQGYNWTTGRTKADLANKMLFVAPILESQGVFNFHPLAAMFFVPLSIYGSHRTQKKNISIEKKEASALNKGVLDLEVINYKDKLKGDALVSGSGAFLWLNCAERVSSGYFIQGEPAQLMNLCTSLGCLCRTTADFVMRADYLPPRKSAFKRAKEKLTEILKEIELNPPIPVPQPAFVPIPIEARYQNE